VFEDNAFTPFCTVVKIPGRFELPSMMIAPSGGDVRFHDSSEEAGGIREIRDKFDRSTCTLADA